MFTLNTEEVQGYFVLPYSQDLVKWAQLKVLRVQGLDTAEILHHLIAEILYHLKPLNYCSS